MLASAISASATSSDVRRSSCAFVQFVRSVRSPSSFAQIVRSVCSPSSFAQFVRPVHGQAPERGSATPEQDQIATSRVAGAIIADLRRDDSGKWTLVFGGGELTMPFLPDALRISLSTGRLYHDVKTKHVALGTPEGIALVKSQLAVELGKHIDVHDFPDVDAMQDVNALIIGDFKWENQHFVIHAID